MVGGLHRTDGADDCFSNAPRPPRRRVAAKVSTWRPTERTTRRRRLFFRRVAAARRRVADAASEARVSSTRSLYKRPLRPRPSAAAASTRRTRSLLQSARRRDKKSRLPRRPHSRAPCRYSPLCRRARRARTRRPACRNASASPRRRVSGSACSGTPAPRRSVGVDSFGLCAPDWRALGAVGFAAGRAARRNASARHSNAAKMPRWTRPLHSCAVATIVAATTATAAPGKQSPWLQCMPPL